MASATAGTTEAARELVGMVPMFTKGMAMPDRYPRARVEAATVKSAASSRSGTRIISMPLTTGTIRLAQVTGRARDTSCQAVREREGRSPAPAGAAVSRFHRFCCRRTNHSRLPRLTTAPGTAPKAAPAAPQSSPRGSRIQARSTMVTTRVNCSRIWDTAVGVISWKPWKYPRRQAAGMDRPMAGTRASMASRARPSFTMPPSMSQGTRAQASPAKATPARAMSPAEIPRILRAPCRSPAAARREIRMDMAAGIPAEDRATRSRYRG